MRYPTTPCVLTDCSEPSHVVLFAQPISWELEGRLTGHRLRHGQAVGFCLRHGGDLLDALRVADGRRADLRDSLATWIREIGWDLTELPQVRADWHNTPKRPVPPWQLAKTNRIRAGVGDRPPAPRRHPR
jgi:hypothetical protein